MPIPDEKARAWTRPEDYWPPRRPKRTGRQAVPSFTPGPGPNEPLGGSRPFLGIVPYLLLMIGLAVLAFAIIVVAWPGRELPQPPAAPAQSEVGTAPKGWMDER